MGEIQMLVLGASNSENSFQNLDYRHHTNNKRKRITRLPLNQFKDEKENSYSKVSPRG